MQEITVSRGNFERCLKCDTCTDVCPMKAVNPLYPGPKQAGPDEERYRLKNPEFYNYLLKYCLNCKRCEVACPSGVKIGDLILEAKLQYGKKSNPLRDFTLSNTDLVGTLSSPLAGIVNPVLGTGPVKAVLHGVMGVDRRRTFPSYSSRKFASLFPKESQKGYRRYVSYFHGCYVNYNYPQLGLDFVRLMNACGYGVRLLDQEKCCGVALISNGFKKQAVRQARVNVAELTKACDRGEPVLTTSSTCTFTMRDEYGHILSLDTSSYRDSLMLCTKWLFDKVDSGEIRLAFRKDFSLKAAYHTPCHMQKLGWQICSVSLLRRIPGLELTVLDQECCGIAGTFGFKKENYAFSQEIGAKLFALIEKAGPEAVITDCETCKWQIEMSTGLPVRNPVSILTEAIDYEATRQLNL